MLTQNELHNEVRFFTKGGKELSFAKEPKAVSMYDAKTNKVIKKFKSISEASRYLDNKYARVYINNCCLGYQKTALGYVWKFSK